MKKGRIVSCISLLAVLLTLGACTQNTDIEDIETQIPPEDSVTLSDIFDSLSSIESLESLWGGFHSVESNENEVIESYFTQDRNANVSGYIANYDREKEEYTQYRYIIDNFQYTLMNNSIIERGEFFDTYSSLLKAYEDPLNDLSSLTNLDYDAYYLVTTSTGYELTISVSDSIYTYTLDSDLSLIKCGLETEDKSYYVEYYNPTLVYEIVDAFNPQDYGEATSANSLLYNIKTSFDYKVQLEYLVEGDTDNLTYGEYQGLTDSELSSRAKAFPSDLPEYELLECTLFITKDAILADFYTWQDIYNINVLIRQYKCSYLFINNEDSMYTFKSVSYGLNPSLSGFFNEDDSGNYEGSISTYFKLPTDFNGYFEFTKLEDDSEYYSLTDEQSIEWFKDLGFDFLLSEERLNAYIDLFNRGDIKFDTIYSSLSSVYSYSGWMCLDDNPSDDDLMFYTDISLSAEISSGGASNYIGLYVESALETLN